MNFPTRETIEELRNEFPVGTKVELVKMDDPHTRLRPGDKGVVRLVDDAGNIHIRWDNGEGLAAAYGEDIVKKARRN